MYIAVYATADSVLEVAECDGVSHKILMRHADAETALKQAVSTACKLNIPIQISTSALALLAPLLLTCGPCPTCTLATVASQATCPTCGTRYTHI